MYLIKFTELLYHYSNLTVVTVNALRNTVARGLEYRPGRKKAGLSGLTYLTESLLGVPARLYWLKLSALSGIYSTSMNVTPVLDITDKSLRSTQLHSLLNIEFGILILDGNQIEPFD